MEKAIKIGVFIIFVGYMILGMIINIPPLINNIIYGAMAIFALFFLFTNREAIGLNDVFKKKEEEEKKN